MKKALIFILILAFINCLTFAHFQIIYTPESVIPADKQALDFILSFTHPFESGLTMDIGKNEAGEIKGLKEFFAMHKGKKQDLLPFLKKGEFESAESKAFAYTFNFNKEAGFRGGGDWVLAAIPYPYFEPSEEGYIQQITKVFINKGSLATDWNNRICEGYPEILPLVKPYEVWEKGVFRALVVDSDGKPVPYADIEFENMNYDVDMLNNKFTGKPKLEKSGAGIIKADNQGVFEFIAPCAGYWGFAALGVGKQKEYEGKELSQDAVIWIQVQEVGDEEEEKSSMEKVKETLEDSDDARSTDKANEKESKKSTSKKEGFSPAALIIVILLFAVMFAWPPIFKKLSDKNEGKKN